MSLTTNSSSVPYCTPAELLTVYAQGIVADLCRVTPSAPPPSYLALLDYQNNPAGKRLYRHLSIAAGEIEGYCGVSKRYTKDDLAALSGVSRDLLNKLNAARGFWSLANYLKPITARVEDIPFAKESWELLQMLKVGEAIFSFYESQEAGLPHVNPANPNNLLTPNVVRVASRLFPTAGQYMNGPWVNRNGGGGN